MTTLSREAKYKFWTPDEDAKFIELVASGKSYSECAKELGRPKSSMADHARRLGISVKPRVSNNPEIVAKYREMHKAGYDDVAAAELLGCAKETIWLLRNRLGLPSNKNSLRGRLNMARSTKLWLHRRGLKHLGDYRTNDNRQLAIARGWPAGLTPAACDILDYLEKQPGNRKQIRGATGRWSCGSKKCNMVYLERVGCVRRGERDADGVVWHLAITRKSES